MKKRQAKKRSNRKARCLKPTRNKRKYFVYVGIAVVAWILLNLSFLTDAMGMTPPGHRADYIFPFNQTPMQGLWAYDITEFIGYALLLPALIIFILRNAFIKGTENLRRKISLCALCAPCLFGLLLASQIDDYYLRMGYYNIIEMAAAAVLIIALLDSLYNKIMN